MTNALRVRCLGDELPEYAAGRLPLERQWAWDRHLVACQVCGHAVAQERRLRSALAGTPSMPGDLRSTLLALGSSLGDATSRPVPAPDPRPLALLAPSAPPCHRSPLRATMVAAAAAGVAGAAAWSLTVIGAPASARPALVTTTTPAVRPAAVPSVPASAVGTTATLELSRPLGRTRVTQQAESTP